MGKCCLCCKWTLVWITSLIALLGLIWFSLSFFFCVSPSCIMTTVSLKISMDPTVDPCDDFYSHACGTWTKIGKSQQLPYLSQFTLRAFYNLLRLNAVLRPTSEQPWAVEQAKIFYKSCQNEVALNQDALSPLQYLLKNLDLPQIPQFFSNSSFESLMAGQLAKMRKYLGASIFVDSSILVDPRNNKKYMLAFHAPLSNHTLQKADLEDKNKRLLSEKLTSGSLDIHKLYKIAFIESVLLIVLKKNVVEGMAEKIYNLTDTLHKLNDDTRSWADEFSSVTDENYMNVQQFQNFTDDYVKSFNFVPEMNWKSYIEVLLGDKKFNESSNLLILNQDYLKKVSLFMAQTPPEHLELLSWWKVVEFSVPFLSQKLRAVHKRFGRDLDGAIAQCLLTMNQYFGFAITRIVADKSFIKDGRHKVQDMLEKIKISFSKEIIKSDWIDADTKSKIMEKKNKLNAHIGYPEWIFDDKALNKYYEGTDMTPDNLLLNMQKVRTQSTERELQKLFWGKQYESEFLFSPMILNAFYNPTSNSMEIPDAILHYPFYNLDLEVLNYAAIGNVIGHEFIHAFDNTGRKYDAQGNLKNWWSNETTSRYKEKSKCFIDQYNNYEMPKNQSVNGTLTLDENIADNGGLRHTFNAYQHWKSEHGSERGLFLLGSYDLDQLFFLEYAHMWCSAYSDDVLEVLLKADPHPPNSVRVNSVLRNSEEFRKTWKCPAGSKMNPEKKCKIW